MISAAPGVPPPISSATSTARRDLPPAVGPTMTGNRITGECRSGPLTSPTMTTGDQRGGGEGEPHRLEQQRREKRSAIAALGLSPYGAAAPGLIDLSAAAARY